VLRSVKLCETEYVHVNRRELRTGAGQERRGRSQNLAVQESKSMRDTLSCSGKICKYDVEGWLAGEI
jgi:hypothetical protein